MDESGVEGRDLEQKPQDAVVKFATFKQGNCVGREITPGEYVEGRLEDQEIGGCGDTPGKNHVNLNRNSENGEELGSGALRTIFSTEQRDSMSDQMWKW